MPKDLVLYDGDCTMCRRMVSWAVARDRSGHLEPMPSQLAPAAVMTPERQKAAETSVLVVTPDGQTLKGGRAVLRILGRVGFKRLERCLLWAPALLVVELGYRLVANNRMALSKFLFRGQAPYAYDAQKEAGAPDGTPASNELG